MKLTVKLAVAGAVLLAGFLFVLRQVERGIGADAGAARAAAANAIRQHRAFVAARARSDSIETVAARMRATAEGTARRLAAAAAATDRVARAAAAQRDSALALAADTATTAPVLRREIFRLAASQSALLDSLTLERHAYAADTLARARAFARDVEALTAKNAALEAAALMHEADASEKRAIRRKAPGVFRRALGGLVATVAGAGCGAGAFTLAGPVGAVAGAAACAAISGALFP